MCHEFKFPVKFVLVSFAEIIGAKWFLKLMHLIMIVLTSSLIHLRNIFGMEDRIMHRVGDIGNQIQ